MRMAEHARKDFGLGIGRNFISEAVCTVYPLYRIYLRLVEIWRENPNKGLATGVIRNQRPLAQHLFNSISTAASWTHPAFIDQSEGDFNNRH